MIKTVNKPSEFNNTVLPCASKNLTVKQKR